MLHLAFLQHFALGVAADRIDDEQRLQAFIYGKFKKDVMPVTKIGTPIYVNFRASLARIIQVVSIILEYIGFFPYSVYFVS